MADPYQDHPSNSPGVDSVWSSVGGSTLWVPGSVNGGSMPAVTSAVTRDTFGRVTAFTDDGGSYTLTYDSLTGLLKTVSNGTVTRTISRDSFGRVTGVA